MNRKALLIGNPGTVGHEDYLPGVVRDLENYKAFLESPLGGAWRPDEIKTLKAPTKDETTNQISSLKGADYSFIVFSGHGRHSKSLDTTIVKLRSGVELSSAALREGAAKHTLILDCCRVITKEIIADSLTAMAKRAGPALHIDACRQYFDQKYI
jgi:Caspase domain